MLLGNKQNKSGLFHNRIDFFNAGIFTGLSGGEEKSPQWHLSSNSSNRSPSDFDRCLSSPVHSDLLILIRFFFFFFLLQRYTIIRSETGHFLSCDFFVSSMTIKLVLKVQVDVCTLLLSSASPFAYEMKGYLFLRGGWSCLPGRLRTCKCGSWPASLVGLTPA